MKQQNFVFGLHAVSAMLTHHPERTIRVVIQKDRNDKKIEQIILLAREHGIAVETMTRQALDQIVSSNHQGVIAFCKSQSTYSEIDLEGLLKASTSSPFILVLDGVQDPHNLGACFRTADAAGVNAIIVPKDNAVGLTPIVSKVASGATETVPFVQVTNLVRTLELLKSLGCWIYGADADASQSVFQADLKGPVVLVLGAEGKGLRRLTREHCDVLLNIPMRGNVSSLNVSVAAGIFMFEVVRQRM